MMMFYNREGSSLRVVGSELYFTELVYLVYHDTLISPLYGGTRSKVDLSII